MHDLRWIRENPEAFDEGLRRRGMAPMAPRLIGLDARRRAGQTELQEARTRRNEASKLIGAAKAQGGDKGGDKGGDQGGDADELIREVADIKDRMQALENEERTVAAELSEALGGIPNLPADDVPDGPDEASNVTVRTVGEPPKFGFEPREHPDIGEALGGMNFERAARLSGARFVVLSGPLARMERALAAFMLDLHTKEFGHLEVSLPVLVRSEALFGTGQLPKFGDDLFRTTGDHWLIPTAEVPLANLVAGEILDEAALPLRFTAHTLCFRSEAGAAGRDTRGMMRQHQFNKVELVSVTHPDGAEEEHERMTGAAEEVLKRLGLAYRVVVLSTGDMGFSASKTYDIEVWLPGQNSYREISSISNCGDFQARRMNARFRPEGGKGTRFVHTLNGSGLAVGRTLIAVIENGQQEDGSVAVPEALRPYMDGVEAITVG